MEWQIYWPGFGLSLTTFRWVHEDLGGMIEVERVLTVGPLQVRWSRYSYN